MTQAPPTTRDLLDLPVAGLLERLSARTPDLGSGPAAGLVAAMAAALVRAAARRSSESWHEAMGVAAQALVLEARCSEIAEADAAAFARASTALARGTDVEGPLRETVAVLLQLGEAAADVAALAAHAAERCEGTFRGDVVAAAQLAEAATRVVEVLVAANLTVVPRDERAVRARRLVEAAAHAARQASEGDR